MPSKPMTICSCGAAWNGVLCTRCGRKKRTHRWADDRERGSRIERGYTKEWQALRLMKLKMEPWCVKCQSEGRATLATTVHHLRYATGPQPMLVPLSDLVSLCGACHGEVEREKARARQ